MNVADAALKLLNIRAYSQYELKSKLLTQGYDEMAVNEAIDYMTERGYLNDAALCDMLLAKFAEVSKYSMKETYIRLRRRGLPANIIKEKITEWDTDIEYQAALKLATKRVKGYSVQDRQKLVRYLSSKGYKSGTIRKVLDYLSDMSP